MAPSPSTIAKQALKHPTALACTSTNARTSLRFVRAFGRGGFFLLLVVSVSVDVGWGLSLVRVSGCAEAKSIDEG